MARAPTMRFEIVGIRVRNFERSLRFYTRVLGFRVSRRGDTRGWGGGLWARLTDPRSGRSMEINWYPRNSRFWGPYVAGSEVDHLDFSIGVASRDTLERTYRRLRRAGARPTGLEPRTTEGWMASVLDPDGVWLTIGRRPTASERAAMRRAQAPT